MCAVVTAGANGWEHSDLQLSSGRLSTLSYGPAGAPLVICVPGLSQDERSFEILGSGIAKGRRRVVAVALRGRGRSQTTPPGTYGLPSHAADLLELATALGAQRFDVVGWSMGGLVGMQLAAMAPLRLHHLVLVDIAGKPEPSAINVIAAGIQRLGAIYPSREAYVARVLSLGTLDGCRNAWVDYLSGDLVPVDGGFGSRTSRQAVMEDAAFNARIDPYALWKSLTMPVLLLRASVPITPGSGVVVTAEDAARFAVEVTQGRVLEIAANHFCIGCAGATVQAIDEFLEA